jgi:hypothetical protein
MLPKVFWFIVIVPSVEGAHQRGAAQRDRVAKGPLLHHRAQVVNVTDVTFFPRGDKQRQKMAALRPWECARAAAPRRGAG